MKFWSKNPFALVILFVAHMVAEIVSKISESAATDGINVNVEKEPEFSATISNTTVPLGREAVLTCSVTDLGNYKVGWMKAEDQTILTLHNRVVTHNGRVSVTNDNFRVWQLHIRQVKESDKGCYMCQINTNIMKKQLGCIDVHIPPDISDQMTASDVTVMEGDNATLTCKAVGHPQPRIIWKREDGENIVLRKSTLAKEISHVETFSGETLHLVKLDRRQMGSYLCIASNDVPPAVSKRITLHINFAPVIKTEMELVGAPLGTNVTLSCVIEAFPYTINYWIKTAENRILQHGTKHNITETRNGYRVQLNVTINRLTGGDLGAYTCVSSNSMGRADGTIRVYEIIIPTTTTTPPTTTTTTTPRRTTTRRTTTTLRPTTRHVVPFTVPPPANSYKDRYQKNHRVEETVKNAISLTDGSRTRSHMPEFKYINNNAIIITINYFSVTSSTFFVYIMLR